MRRCACPGSFDPVTNGHLDVLTRASALFDEVVVPVMVNKAKRGGLFALDERMELLEEVTADLPNVVVTSFEGLLVDFCRTHDIPVVVKGLRAVTDFDYELQMAQMNMRMTGLDTFFVATSPQHAFLSSSLVKEVARFGGEIEGLVPPLVHQRILQRLGANDGSRA